MLRSTAALATGGVVGAVTASSIASESVAADTSLSVSGDEVTIRGESIAAVTLDLTVAWEYEVPSGESPDTLVLDVLAGTSEEDLSVVASDESSQAFLMNSGEESFSVDLLGEGVVDADAITPAERGAETATEIVVGAKLRLLSESDMVIAADSQTDTATVTISKDDYNPDAHGGVSGSGSVTVQVE
mgnify:CR=1 FL=1